MPRCSCKTLNCVHVRLKVRSDEIFSIFFSIGFSIISKRSLKKMEKKISLKKIAKPQFQLFPDLPHFGAKSLERLFIDKYSDVENQKRSPILFKLIYKSKRDGPAYFAKMVGLEKERGKVHHHHPGFIERDFLRLIRQEQLLQRNTPFLPALIADVECPATAVACRALPTRLPAQQIWNHMVVTMIPFYDAVDIYSFVETESVENIRQILFAVMWTLMILQDKYQFVHNDLHGYNVLARKHVLPLPPRQFKLGENCVFKLPSSSFEPMIIDFEHCDIHKPELDFPLNQNGKHYNASQTNPDFFDPHCDLHNFITSILMIESAPKEINDFLMSLYPTPLYPLQVLKSEVLRPQYALMQQLMRVIRFPNLKDEVIQPILKHYPELAEHLKMLQREEKDEKEESDDDDQAMSHHDEEHGDEEHEEQQQSSSKRLNKKLKEVSREAFYLPEDTEEAYSVSRLSRTEIQRRKEFPNKIKDFDQDEDANITRYVYDDKLRSGMIEITPQLKIASIREILLHDPFFACYRVSGLNPDWPTFTHE